MPIRTRNCGRFTAGCDGLSGAQTVYLKMQGSQTIGDYALMSFRRRTLVYDFSIYALIGTGTSVTMTVRKYSGGAWTDTAVSASAARASDGVTQATSSAQALFLPGDLLSVKVVVAGIGYAGDQHQASFATRNA